MNLCNNPLASVLLTAALVSGQIAGTPRPAAAQSAPARPSRAETPSQANGAGGPVLAREDTMHTEVAPVLVSAPRVTLDEILDRVARGEARRDSLMHDASFLATVRVVRSDKTGKQELLMESVTRVYKRRPGQVRAIPLRQWEAHPDKKKNADQGSMKTEFSGSMSEEIVNFAFQPKARQKFRYHITGRDLIGDHLIYRIAFEPASALDVFEPGGLVWVDTKDFVIVKQEISFKQSPVPLFLKGIRRMTIERQRVNGYWVLAHVLMRIETTIPVPKYGRVFDFGIQQTAWTVNEGVPDSIFVGTGKALRRGRVQIGVSK